jgi:hypothetical protein
VLFPLLAKCAVNQIRDWLPLAEAQVQSSYFRVDVMRK